MAQHVRALVAFAEELSLIPSLGNSSSRGSSTLFWLPGYQAYRQSTHTHTNKQQQI